MKNKKIIASVFLAALLGGFIALGTFKLFDEPGLAVYKTVQEKPTVTLSKYQESVPQALDFTYAAEKTTPGVVHIKTYVKVQQNQYQQRYNPMEEMLREFFGDPRGYQQQPQQPQQNGPSERKAGSGSGVVLSMDGYIITNNHVVKGADKIEVVLNDKRSYEADLIGLDPTTDLALLKVSADDLQYVDFGNSDDLKIGEWVLAVGNPFDLTSTVTAGIVSAKARNINILRTNENNMAIESFIQTDAAVNPGNSGGALVNTRGELVGINTAIASPNGAFAGYAFAVPATLVEKVYKDLKEFGEVQRALIGVQIADVTAELAETKNLARIEGVYVVGTTEGGAAEEAGLKENDIITEVNGVEVNTTSELQEIVARYRPGDKVNVKYLRDDKLKEADMVLRNRLGNTDLVNSNIEAKVFGANLRKAEPDVLRKLRLQSGVEVIDIDNGRFKNANIPEGFVITKIDEKQVTSPEDVASIINGSQKDGVLIEGYTQNGSRHFYALSK